MKKLILCSAIIMFLGSPAFAARPLMTDDAGTVDPMHWEIEEGLEISKAEGVTDTSKQLVTGIKFGILGNWDLGIEVPYVLEEGGGFGEADLMTKIRFVDESGAIPAIALKLNITTARSGGGRDYGILGIISKEMGPAMGHLNIGYTIIGNPDPFEDWKVISYGGALEWPINYSVSIAGELSGATNSTTNTSGSDVQLGLDWALNDTVMLDAGLLFGRAEGVNHSQLTAGITLNI